MKSELSLLYPEWQSYGENALVHAGALEIVQSLFKVTDFLHVRVPQEERLQRTNGVLGLNSIAPRFRETIRKLQTIAPAKIFMIGGTCGVEIAPVGYLNDRYQGNLAVIWFDAHGDLNTPISSPSGHFHGMALRTLLGDGPVEYTGELQRFLRPQQVFLAGTRDLDPPEVAYCSEMAISISPSEEFVTPEILVRRIRERGFKNVYLHLDLDVLNPESFPNSLMQTPGGPSTAEVQTMLKALSDNFDVVGFSIVEYCERGGKIKDLKNLVRESGITIGSTRDFAGSC